MAQNLNVLKSQEDNLSLIFEETEKRVPKKLSQEISRTENRILGALSHPVDFLTNPLIQGYSRTTPETSRNAFSANQGTNEDDSQSDLLPEASIFCNQTTQNSGPGYGKDMVTGGPEEVTYCSPSAFSGQQKKNHSTSPPQLRSENNPATIEADQFLLALQQLTNNNNSAKFHNSNHKVTNCKNRPGQRCVCSTGNLKSWSPFDYFVQTNLKSANQLAEADRINYL